MFGIKRAAKFLLQKCYLNQAKIRQKVYRMVSEQGNILDRMGFLHGTDKASIQQTSGYIRIAHDYLRHYDFLFGQFRAEKFPLVEFGCKKGDSLRMWEQYFPNAEVYGVDLDENAKQLEKGRIHIVIGDATSQETYDTLKASTGGSAFIILDDASHAWGDQRRSFELFWDMVSPGGFYVVEDLQAGSAGAYPAYPPKVFDAQPFIEYMKDRCSFLRWSLDELPPEDEQKKEILSNYTQLPEHIRKIEQEIDMCMFIPSAVIVRKKPL